MSNRKIAPPSLAKPKNSYSVAELASIAGLMITVEGEKNATAKPPIRQVIMTVDGRQQKGDWSRPQ